MTTPDDVKRTMDETLKAFASLTLVMGERWSELLGGARVNAALVPFTRDFVIEMRHNVTLMSEALDRMDVELTSLEERGSP